MIASEADRQLLHDVVVAMADICAPGCLGRLHGVIDLRYCETCGPAKARFKRAKEEKER